MGAQRRWCNSEKPATTDFPTCLRCSQYHVGRRILAFGSAVNTSLLSTFLQGIRSLSCVTDNDIFVKVRHFYSRIFQGRWVCVQRGLLCSEVSCLPKSCILVNVHAAYGCSE